MNKVTVSAAIQVNESPTVVWDYTQDWRRRTEWDRSVVSAQYLSEVSPVAIQVQGAGGLKFKVNYKTIDRPRLTTLAMTETNSIWLKGGGGSWKYEDKEGKTLWTQHNTLILRDDLLGRVFRPLFAIILAITTRHIMRTAKANIENRRQISL